MNFDKWHGIGTMVGGMLGAAITVLLTASQVDVVTHWASTIMGVAGAIAATAGAVLLGIKAKRSGTGGGTGTGTGGN